MTLIPPPACCEADFMSAVSVIKSVACQILPSTVLSRIRAARLRRLLDRFPARVVRHLYGQVPLTLWIADPMSEGWYDKDCPEMPEIALLEQHGLAPGATVFALGAHQGVVALRLAAAAGPAGKVVAVEGNPFNVRIARRNREINGADNLYILHAAVGAEAGTLYFNENLNGQVDDGSGVCGRISVTARTVDDLAEEFGHPAVLFLDVEGYEYKVLAGAAKTLEHGADCCVEVHGGEGLEKFGGSVEALLAFFPRERFELMYAEAEGDPFVPLEDAAPLAGKRWFLVAIHRKQEEAE
jgi:FkbM family methyltransferase